MSSCLYEVVRVGILMTNREPGRSQPVLEPDARGEPLRQRFSTATTSDCGISKMASFAIFSIQAEACGTVLVRMMLTMARAGRTCVAPPIHHHSWLGYSATVAQPRRPSSYLVCGTSFSRHRLNAPGCFEYSEPPFCQSRRAS